MLFCEKTWDVIFKSTDGHETYAHSTILRKASQYFDSLFDGNWKENSEGIVNVDMPTEVVKTILTFIYVGNTSIELKYVAEVFSTVSRWEIITLVQCCS